MSRVPEPDSDCKNQWCSVATQRVEHTRSHNVLCVQYRLQTVLLTALVGTIGIASPACSLSGHSASIANPSANDTRPVGSVEADPTLPSEQEGLVFEIDDSWTLDDTSTLKKILYEAASPMYRNLRDMPSIKIVVGYDADRGPVALYRRPGQTTDKLLLSNSPLEYRPQIMYQFAHEFCHVISDYNRLRSTESKNEWFHEALCELASIFVLHSTGEPSLKKYIDDYLEESIQILKKTSDFGTWLLAKEAELREQPTGELDRKANAVVAYRLLPIFMKYPELWNTLKSLPKSDSLIGEYLDEWKQSVKHQDKQLIDLIANSLLPSSSTNEY